MFIKRINCSFSPSGNVHNRIPLRIINRNTREFSSESSGREIKKRKSTINVDEKDNSSITNSSLYVQFVMSQCNEIKSVMQNVYPDNGLCNCIDLPIINYKYSFK